MRPHPEEVEIPKVSHIGPSRAIGKTLRSWREERGLTLRKVEEASREFPEPVAFDYLSRLERGQLMPSVPKLATLANIYQRSLSELVDMYELETLRGLVTSKGDFWHFRQVAIDALSESDTPRAVSAFLKGLEAARRAGDTGLIAQALNGVGHAFLRGGRFHAARRYLEEALRCVEDPRVRGYILDNLAIVHYQLDDLSLADLLSEKAWALAGEDRKLRSLVRTTRASILGDLGRYEDAASLAREALDEFRELGADALEIREMSNLGHYLVMMQRVDEGLAMLRDAMSRAAEHGDPQLRAQSTLYYGRCLHAIGRHDDAASSLISALLIARNREMHKEAFHSAFYLWKLALEQGSETEIHDYEDIARHYRAGIEQRSEEAREFDSWLAERRRKARRRTNA